MTQMTEEKQLRELAERLGNIWQGFVLGEVNKEWAIKQSKDVLEQAGYVQLDEDQSLPSIPVEHQRARGIESVYDDGWRDGFEWLTNKLLGFRRIRRDDE